MKNYKNNQKRNRFRSNGDRGFKRNGNLHKLNNDFNNVSEFKRRNPDTKLIYYSKFTHVEYLRELQEDCIDVLGVDWRFNIADVLKEFSKDYMIQGNFDPAHLHLPWPILEEKLLKWWQEISTSGADLSRWICGLGHGVLQHTPEENVRNAVALIQEKFEY